MLKKFITFSEAAAELNTDVEGLRQGIETGIAIGLPAFVYCGDKPFLARLSGRIERSEYDDASESSVISLKNGVKIRDAFLADESSEIGDMDLGDSLGDVYFTNVSPSETGYPCAFELRGFFRVAGGHMKRAAREGCLGMVNVAPVSWWEGGAPSLLGMELGKPTFFFTLKPTNISRFRDLPDLMDVYFRASDVRAFSTKLKESPDDSKRELDTRERTTQLRLIRALEVMAKLPSRGAASSVLLELQKMGFTNGPGDATIRKVLEQARALEPDSKPQ